jgi:hypothetical protein
MSKPENIDKQIGWLRAFLSNSNANLSSNQIEVLEALIHSSNKRQTQKEAVWWNDLLVKISEIIGLPNVSKAERQKLATDMLNSASDRLASLKEGSK